MKGGGGGVIVHYNMASSESHIHIDKRFDIISYKCRVKPLHGAGSSNRTYAKSGMSPTCGLLKAHHHKSTRQTLS
jgi:hypothetical protein